MSDINGANLSDDIASTGATELFFTSAVVLTKRPGHTLMCEICGVFSATVEESTQNPSKTSALTIDRILIKMVLFSFQMARINSLTISAAATNHSLP